MSIITSIFQRSYDTTVVIFGIALHVRIEMNRPSLILGDTFRPASQSEEGSTLFWYIRFYSTMLHRARYCYGKVGSVPIRRNPNPNPNPKP